MQLQHSLDVCLWDASRHIPVFGAKELNQQVVVAKGNSASYCALLIDQHGAPLSGALVTQQCQNNDIQRRSATFLSHHLASSFHKLNWPNDCDAWPTTEHTPRAGIRLTEHTTGHFRTIHCGPSVTMLTCVEPYHAHTYHKLYNMQVNSVLPLAPSPSLFRVFTIRCKTMWF